MRFLPYRRWTPQCLPSSGSEIDLHHGALEVGGGEQRLGLAPRLPQTDEGVIGNQTQAESEGDSDRRASDSQLGTRYVPWIPPADKNPRRRQAEGENRETPGAPAQPGLHLLLAAGRDQEQRRFLVVGDLRRHDVAPLPGLTGDVEL